MISPIQQAIVVSMMAYFSGLFLGIAIYRGEIGPRRPGAPRPPAPPAPPPRPGEPARVERRYLRRSRSGWERTWYKLEHRARGFLRIVFMLGALLIVAILVYAVLISLPPRPTR